MRPKRVEVDERTRLALIAVSEKTQPLFREFRKQWIMECKSRNLTPSVAASSGMDFVMLHMVRQVFIASGMPLAIVEQIQPTFYHELLAEIQMLVMTTVGEHIDLMRRRQDEMS